ETAARAADVVGTDVVTCGTWPRNRFPFPATGAAVCTAVHGLAGWRPGPPRGHAGRPGARGEINEHRSPRGGCQRRPVPGRAATEIVQEGWSHRAETHGRSSSIAPIQTYVVRRPMWQLRAGPTSVAEPLV